MAPTVPAGDRGVRTTMCWGGGPTPSCLVDAGLEVTAALADCLQHPTAGATLTQGAGHKQAPDSEIQGRRLISHFCIILF